jgi:hypothetical protein
VLELYEVGSFNKFISVKLVNPTQEFKSYGGGFK